MLVGRGLEADCHNSFITLNITPPALSSSLSLIPSFIHLSSLTFSLTRFFFTSCHLHLSLVLSSSFLLNHSFYPSVSLPIYLSCPHKSSLGALQCFSKGSHPLSSFFNNRHMPLHPTSNFTIMTHGP